MVYEPRLLGRSGATHKVEFVLFAPLAVVELRLGHSFRIREPSLEIRLASLNVGTQKASVVVSTGEGGPTRRLKADQACAVELAAAGVRRKFFVKLVAVFANHCRIALLDASSPVASLESKRVGAQRFSGSEALGSGIQTIEKAKQTSLVAVDFDLQYNDCLLVQSAESQSRRFTSFALLGNGVHWTDHDLSVLATYVDFTLLVRDEAIVRYSDYLRQIATAKGEEFFPFFMSYFNGMTNTPADSFEVSSSDFELLRPLKEPYASMSLTELVAKQLPVYEVIASG